MSDRGGEEEWVETTEEEVVIEECVPAVHHSPTGISVLDAAEAPVQTLVENGEATEADVGFYCEDCVPLFQDQTNINGAIILDYPTSMGVPQRALLTLPYGLMIGRSSIPTAGVGVMNHGQALSPGMHFGPYEGEMTTREEAMASNFAWEVYRGEHEYEYIDAARESHSNWMRYINSARNKDETNLLAFQYKGSILYHCCRTIHPGDELMVWPSDRFLTHFSEAWTQAWLMKLNSAETNMTSASEIFLCPHCQLTFTTVAFLQRHMECFHIQPAGGCATPEAEVNDPENLNPDHADPSPSVASLVELSVNPADSKTCEDCGKIFKQAPHLRRHRLCVHSNKRPYCCAQCKRTFSQASGFIRHQLVHRKKAALNGQTEEGPQPSETPDPAEAEEMDASEDQPQVGEATEGEGASVGEAESTLPICSDCGKSFSSEASLRKHKATVHQKLRPYVCNVCQKSFNQYHDLNRHLLLHSKDNRGKDKEGPDNADSLPFSCAKCSLTFSSVDSLERHIGEQHSRETEESGDNDQSKDADFVPPPSVAGAAARCSSQRPQRLGARSRISAITKLIAPKRRGGDGGGSPQSKAKQEESGAEAEGAAAAAGLKKFKWFSCNRCKRTYSDADDLKAHKCTLKQLKCGQCGATFNKSGFLRRHEQKAHADTKSYACQHCDKVFPAPSKLKQHQKSNNCAKYHCTSELFPCSFCQFSFTMKSYLVKHMKRHHPVEFLSHSDGLLDEEAADEEATAAAAAAEKKSYTCPHCGKRFASVRVLKCHACFQQVKVLYLCTDCGKGFSNHYGLKQHQRIHTGEKPYSCPHCAKSFSYTGQLNVHVRTHTGEKPYLCTHCGESFRQSGDLKRHERKHTGVRPYTCSECHKSFSRPQSLKVHQMLHRGQKMFKCTQCGKSFSRNYHLRRHHQKMHL